MTGEHLLHPELIDLIPIRAHAVRGRLEAYAASIAGQDVEEPPITVAIRTLNEAPQVAGLIDDLHAQIFAGEVELIVVDNESTDGTQAVAERNGATVVTLPRERFTYPRSLNMCLEAASHDLVYVVTGHVRLSNDQALRAGVRRFLGPDGNDVGGAYAFPPLPNANASFTELAMIAAAAHRIKPAERIKEAGWGAMAANSAMLRREAWADVGGFDEAYETGAEDSALARTMLAAGLDIWREPVMSVHHTHGLGLLNRARRTLGMYRARRGPVALDRDKLDRHRPDLGISS